MAAGTDMAQVVALYKNTVYGIALARTRNRFDADDVFQEVFLAYHRRQPDFADEAHRKAWLINAAVRCSKRAAARVAVLPLDEQTAQSLLDRGRPEDTAVFAALCALPDKYRTVMHLYYIEGLSTDEIAQALKRRAGTVRMQLLRGRELLKGEVFDV